MAQSGKMIELVQPSYDTVQIAAGVVSVDFFVNPYGGILGTPAVKGYAQTNMIQASQLELGHTLTIQSISMFAHIKQPSSGGAEADILAINSGAFTLWIQQTIFLQTPAALIPEAGAQLLWNDEASNAGTAVTLTHSPGGNIMNAFPIDQQPLRIDPQQTFRVTISEMPTVTNTTNWTVVLWGVLSKPVV
jgi:hypothetical protein